MNFFAFVHEARAITSTYNGGMKRSGRDEWLRDIETRQQNIVFPDTLNNETRGWRNLMEAKRLTPVQQLGIVVLFLFVTGFGLAFAYFISDSFSRRGLLFLLAICVLTFGLISLILVAVRIGIAFTTRQIRNRGKR